MDIKRTIKSINRRKLTNNTQKVALRLLSAEGSWVSRKVLERTISSASARVRDLRKEQFGGFNVECASASTLKRRGDKGAFYYRINPTSVNKSQISKIFKI